MQVAPARAKQNRTNRLQRVLWLGAFCALFISLIASSVTSAETATPTASPTATSSPTVTPTRTPSPTATPFPCPRDSSGMVGTYADIHRWNSVVVQVSGETGVPANVIKAIMWVESRGQLNARSPLTSSGYYFGLMQVGAASALPEYMKDVMWLCDNPYRQTLAGATEMINKSIAIGTRQWDLVAGAYFGYGVDVNGTSTSAYMNMFRGHVIALVGTTPGGDDWIMPPTPTPGPTNTVVPANFSIGHEIQIGSDRINLRSAAGMNGGKIGVLEPGTRATILAGPTRLDNYDWYQIRTSSGATGWAAGQFFVGAEGPPQSPTVTPTVTPSRTPAIESEFDPGDSIMVNVPRLNLRASPSLSTNVLTVLERGNLGTVTGDPVLSGSQLWLQVSMNGQGSGWLAAQYVIETTAVPTATSTSTRVASATPSRTATVTGSSQFASGDPIRVTVPRLNLRTSASLSAGVVVVLTGGDTGTVTGQPVAASRYLWVPITVPGKGSGWVAAQFISRTVGSTVTQTPTRTPTVHVAASATAGTSQSQGTFRVDVPLLNLRANPGMTGQKIGLLVQDQIVNHLGGTQTIAGMTWHHVQAGAQTGWVASPYLVLVASPTTTPTRTPTADPSILAVGESFEVTADLLNMRSNYGTTSGIIRSLPMGTTGSILGGPQTASDYVWYRVSTIYGEGWVAGLYIQRASVMSASLGDAPGLTASLTPEPATATSVPEVTVAPTEAAVASPTETVPPATEPTVVPTDTSVPAPTETATATPTSPPSDADNDGIEDALDACPDVADTGQDSDADGIDDACDPSPFGEPTDVPVVNFQLTFAAGADTSISGVNPDAVQAGDQLSGLPVGGAASETAYLTFWIEGVGSAEVTNATLYLPVSSGSGTVTVSVVPGAAIDEWSLTASTAPIGAVVTTVWAEAGGEIPVDLTGWLVSDGAVTVAVSGAIDPAVVLGSKEGGWPARLVIDATG